MNQEILELLEGATELQIRWVISRTLHTTPGDACRALGINTKTPYKWPNREQLDQVVRLILLDRLEALAAGKDVAAGRRFSMSAQPDSTKLNEMATSNSLVKSDTV